MKVVILCGGLGTSLREETEFRPKPLVEVGGRPILWHIMKLYPQQGFREFVLCLGYRGRMIKEYFLNYEGMNSDFTICLGNKPQIAYDGDHGEQGFAVTLAETGEESMTGILDIDDARHFRSFSEKPRSDAWASAVFFVFQRRIFEYLDGDECILERQPLERLAREGELVAYHNEGFFCAMDTYREYELLNELWKTDRAPWKKW
jgi:glucose-1-phosphate cytidylyltransferase